MRELESLVPPLLTLCLDAGAAICEHYNAPDAHEYQAKGDDSPLTLADIALSYPMESAHSRGYIGGAYPNCEAWLERIKARPAFQSAKDIDGRPSMVLPLKS